jgi:hypothetical protein
VGRPFVRSCDPCSIACRWNSFEVTVERSDERRHLPVALAPAEAAFRVEPPDGEPGLEAFAQARRRIGPTRLELRCEVPAGTFTLRRIVVTERGGELAIDPRLLVLREVVGDVAGLVRRAPLDEHGTERMANADQIQ